MSRKPNRVIDRKLKLLAIRRMEAGENVSALARELGVLRKDLYVWLERFRAGGVEGLRGRGRPPKRNTEAPPAPPEAEGEGSSAFSGADAALTAAQARIAELERKVGRQALELDFFQKALQHFKETRQPNDGPGVTASMRSSDR